MSKKEELIIKLQEKGIEGISIRWIPNNPYGKKPKLHGWVYQSNESSEWIKLGNNFEDAVKEINSI